MASPVDSLLDDLSVTPVEDGRVAVTVLLPPDLVQEYCRLLDSLAGFFHSINRKSFVATIPERAASRAAEAEFAVSAYASLVVSTYDRYTSEGLTRSQAIRQIGADLRSKSHPWSSPDLVRHQLIASGRSGRPGRPRKSRVEP